MRKLVIIMLMGLMVLSGCATAPETQPVSKPVEPVQTSDTNMASENTIGEMTYGIPAGYVLSDGSANENRIYFNGDSQKIIVRVQDGEFVSHMSDTYVGEEKTYFGITGFEYTKDDGSKGFVFTADDKTYFIEADSVYDAVISSISIKE